jgi:hypothetical protein
MSQLPNIKDIIWEDCNQPNLIEKIICNLDEKEANFSIIFKRNLYAIESRTFIQLLVATFVDFKFETSSSSTKNLKIKFFLTNWAIAFIELINQGSMDLHTGLLVKDSSVI